MGSAGGYVPHGRMMKQVSAPGGRPSVEEVQEEQLTESSLDESTSEEDSSDDEDDEKSGTNGKAAIPMPRFQ